MELLLTLSSTNENKTIMDILAQLASEAIEQKNMEREVQQPSRSSMIKKFLIKGAAKTVEFIGEDAVNSVFSMLKPTLAKVINDNLQQNRIPAVFSVEEIIKEDEKMKITIVQESIHYAGVINKFLPGIISSVRENDPGNYLWRVYDVISDDQPEIVRAVLDTISDEKKEEMIEMMIIQNKHQICDKVSEFLIAQNIEIAVDDIIVNIESDYA